MRGRRAPALVNLPLFFEDVGLGPELEPGLGQPEAAREVAGRRRARAVRLRVFGALDRHGEDVVVGEQLDGPLGAARGVGDEDDGVAALAAAADLRDPVLHAAVELHRRLTGHVARRCADPRSSSPISSVSSAVAPSSQPPRVLPRRRSTAPAAPRARPSPPLPRSWRRSAASASRPARAPRPAPRRARAGADRSTGSRRPSPIDPAARPRPRRRSAPAAARWRPDRAPPVDRCVAGS